MCDGTPSPEEERGTRWKELQRKRGALKVRWEAFERRCAARLVASGASTRLLAFYTRRQARALAQTEEETQTRNQTLLSFLEHEHKNPSQEHTRAARILNSSRSLFFSCVRSIQFTHKDELEGKREIAVREELEKKQVLQEARKCEQLEALERANQRDMLPTVVPEDPSDENRFIPHEREPVDVEETPQDDEVEESSRHPSLPVSNSPHHQEPHSPRDPTQTLDQGVLPKEGVSPIDMEGLEKPFFIQEEERGMAHDVEEEVGKESQEPQEEEPHDFIPVQLTPQQRLSVLRALIRKIEVSLTEDDHDMFETECPREIRAQITQMALSGTHLDAFGVDSCAQTMLDLLGDHPRGLVPVQFVHDILLPSPSPPSADDLSSFLVDEDLLFWNALRVHLDTLVLEEVLSAEGVAAVFGPLLVPKDLLAHETDFVRLKMIKFLCAILGPPPLPDESEPEGEREEEQEEQPLPPKPSDKHVPTTTRPQTPPLLFRETSGKSVFSIKSTKSATSSMSTGLTQRRIIGGRTLDDMLDDDLGLGMEDSLSLGEQQSPIAGHASTFHEDDFDF